LAFQSEVLTSDVIPLYAAFAAQDFGDARNAIDIFRHSDNLAYEQDAEQVTEAHVREARTEAEKDRFKELLEGVSQQAKAVLLALQFSRTPRTRRIRDTTRLSPVFEHLQNN
jgi:archaeal cell division control protein 6